MSPVRFSPYIVPTEYLDRISDQIEGGYGLDVATEGAVTPSAGLTLAVAAISANAYRIAGAPVTAAYAGGTVTHGAAHATNPRLDLVYVDTAGAVGIVAGTAAANPEPPAIGATTRMHLAEVRVPANAVAISVSDITDKRPRTLVGWEHIDTQILSGAAAAVTFSGLSAAYRAFLMVGHIEKDATGGAIVFRINNDAGANYEYVRDGVTSGGLAANSVMNAANTVSPSATVAAGESGQFEALFSKPLAAQEGVFQCAVTQLEAAAGPGGEDLAGTWENVADLISRLDVIAGATNFAADTRVTLWGLRVTT